MEKTKLFNQKTDCTESENESMYDDVPDDMKPFWRMMSKAAFEPLIYDDTRNEKPDWLDLEKFKKGQKFAMNNYGSISSTVLHALLMLFTFPLARKTFIFTESFIPETRASKKALKLYTALTSWFTDDIWSDENCAARLRMKRTNKMHEYYYQKLLSLPEEKINEKTALKDIDEVDLNLYRFISEDFANDFPSTSLYEEMKRRNKYEVTISQSGASFTLFGLAGLAITYPKYYGLRNATEEDLENYAHTWRALGYLIGIRDEYNFLNADLQTIRSRTKSVIECYMRPAFRDLDKNWEYFTRNFVGGLLMHVPKPFCSFECLVLDLLNFLGVNYRLTKKYMSFLYYLQFLSIRFFFAFLIRIPGARKMLNMIPKVFLLVKVYAFWTLTEQLQKKMKELLTSPDPSFQNCGHYTM